MIIYFYTFYYYYYFFNNYLRWKITFLLFTRWQFIFILFTIMIFFFNNSLRWQITFLLFFRWQFIFILFTIITIITISLITLLDDKLLFYYLLDDNLFNQFLFLYFYFIHITSYYTFLTLLRVNIKRTIHFKKITKITLLRFLS